MPQAVGEIYKPTVSTMEKIQRCAQLFGFLRNVFCPAPGFSLSWLEGYKDSQMLPLPPEEPTCTLQSSDAAFWSRALCAKMLDGLISLQVHRTKMCQAILASSVVTCVFHGDSS